MGVPYYAHEQKARPDPLTRDPLTRGGVNTRPSKAAGQGERQGQRTGERQVVIEGRLQQK